MKVAIFSTHEFDRPFLETAQNDSIDLKFFDVPLSLETVELARGYEAVSCFVSDTLDSATLHQLSQMGVKLLALRSAGFNHLDVATAARLKIACVYVPDYSPFAIAEYAIGLLQCLNRKIHLADQRVHERSFLLDGFTGFDLHRKTIGVMGTGRIGKVVCKILRGFECDVIAHDIEPNWDWAEELLVRYQSPHELLMNSDVVTIHLPLKPATHHLIDRDAINQMKKNAILINTSRGAIVDSLALIEAIEAKQLAGACLDVYENEGPIFFRAASPAAESDQLLARLLSNKNVLLTGHQAFLTQEALRNIADTTLESCRRFASGQEISSVQVPGTVR